MKYSFQPKVRPDLAAKSEKDIDSINAYMDNLRGTVITIKTIRHGQARAYADSVYEAVIYCYQPNVLTTNAPLPRYITKETAKVLARLFVHDWADTPKFGEPSLEFLGPEPDPCRLVTSPMPLDKSSCWRVVVMQPYLD